MRFLAVCLVLGLAAPPSAGAALDFNHVREIAVRRAAEPYRKSGHPLPPRLAALTYDEMHRITFRPERALWHADQLPFQVQFHPRGGLFTQRIALHEVTPERAEPVRYDPAAFALREIHELPALPGDLGYAGFKLLFPLNRRDAADEVVSFLGASYFRAVAAGQAYGLSARGLALDAAIDGRAEEFPEFIEFWLRRPAPRDRQITLYALMDSPSVAGAFEFVIAPGQQTVTDITAALIFRDASKVPGFAPLTSMFWYGENSTPPAEEKRPEVHDSDGLFVHDRAHARWWIPLRSAEKSETIDLPLRELARFGLAQRDRDPGHYRDPNVNYERRPTAWIEPRGEWGAGFVRLVQLPPTKEYGDNIVAYWVPEARPHPGKPVDLRYRLIWGNEEPHDGARARVVATREAPRPDKAGVTFSLDVADAQFRRRDAKAIRVEATASGGGKIVRSEAKQDAAIGGWRITLELDAGAASRPVDVECRLREAADMLSETWRYRWKATAPPRPAAQ